MASDSQTGESPRMFPNTHWSVVLRATATPSPESSAALETICRDYWHPLYAYARRCGQAEHDAQDLTQEFFRRLLEKRWLEKADREKGRLRTFLILALKHFMANEWRRNSALKRGGGHAAVQLDTSFAESPAATDATLSPEEVFDRQWALTLLELTVKKLQAEFTGAGKADEFDKLKHCLMTDHGSIDYALMAEQLGMNQGAARVAVHRLRKRFREIYRQEISQTLADGAELEAELRHLAAALARQ